MDVRQLEMFRTVAEDGTFTRAAERLRVSQSAISRQVKLLEEELGGVLLHRGARRVSLTPAGELLLKMANRLHRDMQDVVSQISDTHGLRRGSLTLAGGMTVCMYILPGVLKKYRRLYPQVDLRVVSGASETDPAQDPHPRGRPGAADPAHHGPGSRGAAGAPGRDGGGHGARPPPCRGSEPSTCGASGSFPLILYESGSNTRRVLDRLFAEESVPMKVAMETENVEIIKAMVASGLGITIVPFQAVARDVRPAAGFAYRRLRGQRLFRETGWVYLKTDHLPRTISEMLRVFDAIRSQFGGRPPAP